MVKCSIVGCNSHRMPRFTSKHSLYRDGKFNEDWIESIKTLNGQDVDVNTISKRFCVCDMHFEKYYLRNYGPKNHLTSEAIPTIFPKRAKDVLLNDTTRPGSPECILSDGIHNSLLNDDFKQVPCSEVKVKVESDDTSSVRPDRAFIPSIKRKILEEKSITQHVKKRKQKFDIDRASPTTLKRKCLHYMELKKQKNRLLKILRRKLIRKEEQIKALTARLRELQNAKYPRKPYQ